MIAVGSHDTASAVVGVPADGRTLRLHLLRHLVAGRRRAGRARCSPRRAGAANFTNEAGVDGTVRYLRNVMGLWLLQESLRTWAADGRRRPRRRCSREAAEVPALRPGGRPRRPGLPAARATCPRGSPRLPPAGQPVPPTPAATVRCILDSLALAHRRAVRQAQELAGRHGRRRAHRRRRRPQRAAVPAHRRRLRPAGGRRAGRGRRARQRAGPGARRRGGPGRARRDARPAAAHAASCGATTPAAPPPRGTTPNGGSAPRG